MRYLSRPEQLAEPHDRWLSRELSELWEEQGRQPSNHREYDLGVRILLCASLMGRAAEPTQNQFPWDLLETAVPSFALELPSPLTLSKPFLNQNSCNCPACQYSNKAQTLSSQYPNKNNKVTLHIIFIGVAGTVYNDKKEKATYSGKALPTSIKERDTLANKNREYPSPEDERGVNVDQVGFWQHAAPGHQ
eukprot:1160695-Pelagomonas_calceolata.AAC.1